MNEELVEILEFHGEGYEPLVDFNSWRVASLRFIDELIPGNIRQLERHVETDEVFVLLEGKAILFLGGGENEVKELHCQVMEPGKLFNVRKNTWHTCVLSRDGTVLLVENKDTSKENSEYLALDASQREYLIETSAIHIQEWGL